MTHTNLSKKTTILIVSLTIIFLGISLFNLKIASRNNKTGTQVQIMAEDFESYRKLAMAQKIRSAIWIGPNEYVFKTYSSLGENMSNPKTGTPVAGRELRHEMAKIRAGKIYSLDVNKDRIEFDGRGLSSNIPANRIDFVNWPVNLNMKENCLVIYPMRVTKGTMKDEKTCSPEH